MKQSEENTVYQNKQEDIEKQNSDNIETEEPQMADNEVNSGYVLLKEAEFKTLLTSMDTNSSSISISTMYYTNQGIVVGDNSNLQNTEMQVGIGKEGPNKSVDRHQPYCFIEDDEQLMKWMSEHYQDFEMAFIIAMAVFEDMPCLWIYEAAEELFSLFTRQDEQAVTDMERIARTQRIQSLGGVTYFDIVYNYTGQVNSEFICFQGTEYADKILRYVWSEHTFLRMILIQWLDKYISDKNYSKAGKSMQAMALFAQCDFDFFSREVIGKILAKKSFLSSYATAQIVLKLYQDVGYQKNINRVCSYWIDKDNIYSLWSALLIAVEGIGKKTELGLEEINPELTLEVAVSEYLERLLRAIQLNKNKEYIMELSTFFTIGQRKAVFFKAIVAVLYDKMNMYTGYRYREEKANVGRAFFFLLWIDRSQSNIDVVDSRKYKDMVFVKMCLIENETTEKVRTLWKYIWENRFLSKWTQKLLEQYLYQYGGCGQEYIIYLRKFLYSFLDSEFERKRMESFLRKISGQRNFPVEVAERISNSIQQRE